MQLDDFSPERTRSIENYKSEQWLRFVERQPKTKPKYSRSQILTVIAFWFILLLIIATFFLQPKKVKNENPAPVTPAAVTHSQDQVRR